MKKLKLQVLLVPAHLSLIPTGSLDNIQTKRFLHLADPSDDLNKIKLDIQARYCKLYPDEEELIIEKFQDNDLCDLDLDYGVDDVFESGNLIRVIIFNDLSRYPGGDKSSFFLTNRSEYPIIADHPQSTPKVPPPAPNLSNNPNLISLERENEYFVQANGRTPNKPEVPIVRSPLMKMGKMSVQSPKINNDPNISLLPPEDNYNNLIPVKHHIEINEAATPGPKKRITSGMLTIPQHTKVDNKSNLIPEDNHKMEYTQNDVNSSFDIEETKSESIQSPKRVMTKDLVINDQLVPSKVSNDSYSLAPASKPLPSDTNISSDDDELGIRREAAIYKDPLKQHYVINKDEVIDIFKHRIVRANKQIANNDIKDKYATQVIESLSIDMIDAPKTSEYIGTRSSRKAIEDPRNRLSKERFTRRETSNLSKSLERSKIDKNDKDTDRKEKNMSLGKGSIRNPEPNPREPLKKLKLIYERMKAFEQKLDSLITPDRIFPKKNTSFIIEPDSDEEVDQLLINPKVHLLPDNFNKDKTPTETYNSSGSQINSKPDDSVNGTKVTLPTAFVSNKNENKTSHKSNSKPVPAFDITKSVQNSTKSLDHDIASRHKSEAPSANLTNGRDNTNFTTPSQDLTKKLQNYLPTYKKRAIELLENAQNKNSTSQSQNTHEKLGEVEKPKSSVSQLVKNTPASSIKPTPNKRKFDVSSSEEDVDSSDSEIDANETKKPRLVASVPTKRSQSPVTPMTNSNLKSSMNQKSNLLKTNSSQNSKVQSTLILQDSGFQTPNTSTKTKFANTIRKPLLTSLDDLALRGVPEVKDNIKSNSTPNNVLKATENKDEDSSSSEDDSSSSSSDDEDDKRGHDYKSPKFLSLKSASAKKPKKKKSNLFSTLKR